jgi:hypothetical protein
MTEHALTLRPTVIGGDRLKNDFCVYLEGRSVGRIKLSENHVQRVDTWRWHINPPLPIPPWGNGSAPTLEQAKVDFREAWDRFYASLTPEDISHWHLTDRSAK